MTMVACPQCQAQNRPTARFCRSCVAPLPQRSAEAFAATVQDPGLSTPSVVPLDRLALPAGHRIEGFQIEEVIGQGGFGIVYRAWDVDLERHVAIKEYLPATLVAREPDSLRLAVRPGEATQAFSVGLSSFVNEARLLARFDHRALVKVFRFWEANGTAYMAMPFYRGPTLKAALGYLRRPPSERLVRKWLTPLLDALEILHGADCFHRDISPDNILLTTEGPVLLDFGAARRVIADRTQVLTTLLKPSFAPIEQYGSTGAQGAWTDLYALAGVVHYAIAGRAPPPATVRVLNDPWVPLSKQPALAARYSASLLGAIDAALTVLPSGRPQSVSALRQMLVDAPARPKPTPPAIAEAYRPALLAAVDSAFAGLTESRPQALATPASAPAPLAAPSSTQARTRRSSRALVPALALLLAVGGGAFWWLSRPASPAAPMATVVPSAPVATPVSPPPAVVVPVTAATEAPSQPVAAATPTTDAAPAAARESTATTRKTVSVNASAPARPVAKPAAERPVRERSRESVVASAQADTPAPAAATPQAPPRGARCSDLMLQSSLQPLGKQDLAYLRDQCK